MKVKLFLIHGTLGIIELTTLRKFVFLQKLSYIHTCGTSPNTFTEWYSVKDSRGLLWRFWKLSLLCSLLFRILSWKFYSPKSPQTPNICFLNQQDHCALLVFALPALHTENSLWAESWGMVEFILYVSLLSGTLSPMRPVVQCLKTIMLHFCPVFLVQVWTVTLMDGERKRDRDRERKTERERQK